MVVQVKNDLWTCVSASIAFGEARTRLEERVSCMTACQYLPLLSSRGIDKMYREQSATVVGRSLLKGTLPTSDAPASNIRYDKSTHADGCVCY